MAELQFPDIAGQFQRGLAFGTARRQEQQADQQRNMLQGLAPQVIAGDPNAYAQAAAIDPDAANKYQSAGDAQLRRLKGAIDYIEGAKKSGNPQAIESAYQQVRPYLARFGQEPPATFAEAEPKFNEAKARIAMLSADASGLPTGFRELDLKARAAGFQPGTPEYQQAMRVGVGVEGRAATGGFGFEVVEGLDGRKRMQRRNPRTGVVEIYDESTGDFSPMGGGPPLNGGAPAPAGAPAAPAPQPTMTVNFDGLTPEQNQRIATTAALMRQAGYPDAEIDTFVNAQGNPPQYLAPNGTPVAAPTMPQGRANPALAVSQTPAEKAGAETAAKQAAEIAALEERGRIEALNAGRTEAAKQQAQVDATAPKIEAETRAKSAADLRSALPDLKQSQAALLDAYNGFKQGRYKSGPVIGAIPSQFQSPDNQYLLTTINDQILATAERMKGTLSDKDVAFLKSATFNLNNDERANMNIIGRKLALINQAIKRAESGGTSGPQQSGRYQVGQIINAGGKRYRVTGGDLNDPDVEEVR